MNKRRGMKHSRKRETRMNIKLNRVDTKVESHLHIQWKQKKKLTRFVLHYVYLLCSDKWNNLLVERN